MGLAEDVEEVAIDCYIWADCNFARASGGHIVYCDIRLYRVAFTLIACPVSAPVRTGESGVLFTTTSG